MKTNKSKTPALPCPFCGGKATVKRHPKSPPEIMSGYYSVGCGLPNSCTVWPDAYGDTREECVAKWNTRHERMITATAEIRHEPGTAMLVRRSDALMQVTALLDTLLAMRPSVMETLATAKTVSEIAHKALAYEEGQP
jgi:hypothetical protein